MKLRHPLILCASIALACTARAAEKKPAAAAELTATEWAGESLLGSSVAISMDHAGRAYVVQTTRRKTQELDIRQHTAWVPQVLAFRTVEDRRKFYEAEMSAARSPKNAGWLKDRTGDGISDFRDLGVLSELVLRIEDKAGRGVADTRTVFASGLNSEMTGVAAGVLAFGDSVFVTAIPSLWKFSAQRAPGPADPKREELVTGFGVHVAYSGHDMHGLTAGPDGRIYWSIGDKGTSVALPDGRRVAAPHEGAVLRCEPDGSGFEIYAHGLRNPQELAFDEWGNLFSVDNDGDFKGERERFVYITERSDSGWRCNWQYRKGDYNPWMDERLSEPAWAGQAAYITPPLANYSDGPCGFAYNPGTALGARQRGTFFLTHFPGRKLTAFRAEPAGAGFKMSDERLAFSGPMMTGLAWGPDGALYVTDWNSADWDPHEKGKIWKLDVPGADADPLRAETKRILGEGMAQRGAEELAKLLAHADSRVRLGAQFELAKRGDAQPLLAAAKSAPSRLARVHGIWGVGQLARRQAAAGAPLIALLADGDAEIRAQAAKVLGDAHATAAADALQKLLADPAERVRFHAAIALGKIGAPRAVKAIAAMIAKDDGKDTFLRHAGATALAGADAEQVAALHRSPSEAVRIAAVVALRRMNHAGAAEFLRDSAPLVAAEAARAIHDDESIPAALPALAAMLETGDPVIIRRAISANLRTGGAESARRLAAYAARQDAPAALRIEALTTLGTWTAPAVLDRVEGRSRPLEPRPAADVQAALEQGFALFSDAAPAIRSAAFELAGKVNFTRAADAAFAAVNDAQQPAAVRQAALGALAALKDSRLSAATKTAGDSEDGALRATALKLIAAKGNAGADVVPLLVKALQRGKTAEQQSALATLGTVKSPDATAAIASWLDRLATGKVPPALQLDVLEAARSNGTFAEKLAAYDKSKSTGDPIAPFREALAGGDAARGKSIALEHLAAQCTRCHKLGGAGAEVGPDLSKVAARLPREQLLESLVAPGAKITPGYGIIVATLKDGHSVGGTIAAETATELTLRAPDGVQTKIAKPEIQSRTEPTSMMPPMGALLTPRELRDVVEYLGTLK